MPESYSDDQNNNDKKTENKYVHRQPLQETSKVYVRKYFMYFWLTIISVLAIFLAQPEADPDLFVKTPQLIESRGFLCQEHFIQTSDGYIIAVHRIVNPVVKTKGRPVLFWHGLGGTSRDFLINDGRGSINESTDVVGNNIGFELAKRGYDVWLANARGTPYSKNHTVLDPEKDKEFWNFSYDEMIEIDLPQVIDYILQETERKTIGYVGHSQGTLVMFGLLASQEKYNEIVKPFIGLAPVAMVDKVTPFFSFFAHRTLIRLWLGSSPGPIRPATQMEHNIKYQFCSTFGKYVCIAFTGFVYGYNHAQLNFSRTHVYISGVPVGISYKNVLQLAQNVKSSVFSRFDYEPEGNMAKYASSLPPEYFLQNITNKHIALFSSLNDRLATQGNVDNIRSRLKVKIMDDYVVPIKDWNHADFLLALESGKYVNSRILDILGQYES